MENKKIFFRFTEDDKGKVHSVPRSELLTAEELPLSDSADIVGMKVLAPWYSDTELTVRHAEAIIVDGRKSAAGQICITVTVLPAYVCKSIRFVSQIPTSVFKCPLLQLFISR